MGKGGEAVVGPVSVSWPVSSTSNRPVYVQVGWIRTDSPGSKTPLTLEESGTSSTTSTARFAGMRSTGSSWQTAEQPSPPWVSLSSHPSRPSSVPLPQVAGGVWPGVPLFLIGLGTTVIQSLALSSVSSHSSRIAGWPQMSSRRRAA